MSKETKSTNQYTNQHQKGQALLFVVIAMTIALSIGINASVRTLTSLSRTTRTDTASRALAAAEGGIERFIALTTQELEDAVEVSQGTGTDCPIGHVSELEEDQYCRVDFEGEADILISQAFVSVERYTPDFYPFSLEAGQVKEVNLYDFTVSPTQYYSDDEIEICWDPVDPNAEVDVMYIAYDQNGIQAKGGLEGNPPPELPYHSEGFDSPSNGPHAGSHDSCYRVNITSNDIYGLRVRALGADANITIYPIGDDLPLQGYEITSIGKLEQDQGVTATRIIHIIRTLPYLPISFDYALYSEAPIFK